MFVLYVDIYMIQQWEILDNGAAGTPFADIPDTWVCPLCGVGKSEFEKQNNK